MSTGADDIRGSELGTQTCIGSSNVIMLKDQTDMMGGMVVFVSALAVVGSGGQVTLVANPLHIRA
jgi:hypothetical protein